MQKYDYRVVLCLAARVELLVRHESTNQTAALVQRAQNALTLQLAQRRLDVDRLGTVLVGSFESTAPSYGAGALGVVLAEPFVASNIVDGPTPRTPNRLQPS